MKIVTIDQIIRDEKNVTFAIGDSFNLSYPEFVKYFSNIPKITYHNLTIAANFTYGWMPTMFKFKSTNFEQPLDILNNVREENDITIPDLEALITLLNNSIIGTSKLLHFINPKKYAIYDSRVYRYINGCDKYYDMVKPQNYFSYLDNCKQLIVKPQFESIHKSINSKLGYEVTPFRAVELVMFVNG